MNIDIRLSYTEQVKLFPPKLKNLIITRCKEGRFKGIFINKSDEEILYLFSIHSASSFRWEDSQEGVEFWMHIALTSLSEGYTLRNRLDLFYKYYPRHKQKLKLRFKIIK